MTASSDQRGRRLLVVSNLFPPDSCGGAPIFEDLCCGLAGRGFQVTVLCAYPYYPEWEDKSGRNGLRIERSRERGLEIERYGLYIPRDPRSLRQRLLFEVSFFLSISRRLFRSSRFDAALIFCPLAGNVAFAGLLKLLHRTPICLNIQDLPADAAAAGGTDHRGLAQDDAQAIQKLLFNRGDVWRSISPVMIERLEALRWRNQSVHLIPDWLHTSLADGLRGLPSNVGRPPRRPIRLLYSGNIGGKQGLLDFCEVLHASSASFDFRIHGDGGSAAQVADWVASSGDRRFSFSPLVSEPMFIQALHDADFFVITEKPGSGASFFPSKTIPAMAAGTPILAVSSPESPLGRRDAVRAPTGNSLVLRWDQSGRDRRCRASQDAGILAARFPWVAAECAQAQPVLRSGALPRFVPESDPRRPDWCPGLITATQPICATARRSGAAESSSDSPKASRSVFREGDLRR